MPRHRSRRGADRRAVPRRHDRRRPRTRRPATRRPTSGRPGGGRGSCAPPASWTTTWFAGRLVGMLWAAVSMWSIFLLSRAMGAARAASLVASSTVLLVPALQQQYTFVTPHALDIPVGAFAALATLRFLRREWPWWTLVLAGLGVAGVKGSNVVVVVGLGIALLAVIAWPGTHDRAVRLRAAGRRCPARRQHRGLHRGLDARRPRDADRRSRPAGQLRGHGAGSPPAGVRQLQVPRPVRRGRARDCRPSGSRWP